jgi:hypothetical protein
MFLGDQQQVQKKPSNKLEENGESGTALEGVVENILT